MGNNVNDINKVINYGYRKKYAFLKKKISTKDILKYKDYVILYIPKQNNLNYWIIEKYFFPKVHKIKILKNLLDDDMNVIYLLYLDENNDKELIYTIHYLYYFNFDIFVYKTPLENIINFKHFEQFDFLKKEFLTYQNLFNLLNKRYHIKKKIFFNIFYIKYIKPIIINFAKAESISYKYSIDYNKNIIELYNLRDELLIDMLKVKKSDLKKTGELFYLKLFRDKFPDTIYQYHSRWLGKQSLDLFIPSKNVGIEIQGTQHYRPVDYFGGNKQFIKQKYLDKRKANLCKENGVKLYYINNSSNVDDLKNDNDSFDKIIEEIVNIK